MACPKLLVLLLLLCAACATPQELVRVPGVEVEQVCEYLQEAGYDTGGCLVMWSGKMREAVKLFQEHQQLPPADGRVDAKTWLRLQAVVLARRKPGPKEAPAGPAVAKAGPPSSPAPAPPPAQAALPVKPAPALAPPPPPPPPPLREGMRVLVVERSKCLPRSGAWVLAYLGVLQGWQEGRPLVKLESRVSYRYNPGEKGVDRKDWFCVPRRLHCYGAVPFGDWGGRHQQGEVAPFQAKQVRYLNDDPKDALYAVAQQACR